MAAFATSPGWLLHKQRKAPGASVAEQTKLILADIEEMLASAGTSKAHRLAWADHSMAFWVIYQYRTP
jgi:hypothetical protein